MRKSFVVLVLVLLAAFAHAQKQLVLLRREKVILRLYPGDDIAFREKGQKYVRHSYVNNLSDTAVVTHNDTIPYHTIDRLYFRQRKFYNVLGAALVVGGTGYILVDQVNELVVQGNSSSWDRRVNLVAIPSAIIGLPLMLIHKKSQRMTPKYHLLMVKPGSIFYKANPKGYQSPFIP